MFTVAVLLNAYVAGVLSPQLMIGFSSYFYTMSLLVKRKMHKIIYFLKNNVFFNYFIVEYIVNYWLDLVQTWSTAVYMIVNNVVLGNVV